MKIQPYKISVPQTVLDDLRLRLARTRWPDEVAALVGTMALIWVNWAKRLARWLGITGH